MQIVEEKTQINRDNIIIRTSIIGIITNIFLVGFKMFVGLISNSIAIILDAVNNLSDAMSSIITIVGTKLANKKPDKNHPMGYGRIEYLTAMIVAGLVLYAGITSLIESVKKIIHPEKPDYATTSIIIISVAVAVKIILGKFVKTQGEKVNSSALVASGSDAMFDAILSFSVLVSALIFIFTKISLEAYVGAAISLFIIKSGIGMLIDTLNEILGQRADKELTQKVKYIVASHKNVTGAFDLFMYNYGPNKNYASVHIEVPDTMLADELDILTREIEKDVYHKTGVIMTGIGIYSYNTKDPNVSAMRHEIQKIVFENDFVIQMHGFYADMANKNIRFDIVLNFEIEAREGVKKVTSDLKKEFPDFEFVISPDVDVSD